MKINKTITGNYVLSLIFLLLDFLIITNYMKYGVIKMYYKHSHEVYAVYEGNEAIAYIVGMTTIGVTLLIFAIRQHYLFIQRNKESNQGMDLTR